MCSARDQIEVDHMQGKHFNTCAISLAPKIAYFKLYFNFPSFNSLLIFLNLFTK